LKPQALAERVATRATSRAAHAHWPRAIDRGPPIKPPAAFLFEQERAKFGERSAWVNVASVLLNRMNLS
jgi:hypothetical protein